MRRSIGLLLLTVSLSGCAALSTWDGFSGHKDADLVSDTAETPTTRPLDAGREAAPVAVSGDESPAPPPPLAPITLVQSSLASTEDVKSSSFGTVLATTAQKAGSLNVVIIGWYDSAIDATSVTDS